MDYWNKDLDELGGIKRDDIPENATVSASASKMVMNKTPLTDALANELNVLHGTPTMIEHARDLETRLAAAQAKLDKYNDES